ncbi:MAG TPA: hypothetical protein VMD48_12460 [Solirubrobacteraceae bacterium]|nr:hypothetical protein [Solirubrobacteraceae bacterium]
MTFLKHRIAVVGAVVAVAAGVLAAGTSAHESLVHAYRATDGTVVVSGYDGGVAVAPSHK